MVEWAAFVTAATIFIVGMPPYGTDDLVATFLKLVATTLVALSDTTGLAFRYSITAGICAHELCVTYTRDRRDRRIVKIAAACLLITALSVMAGIKSDVWLGIAALMWAISTLLHKILFKSTTTEKARAIEQIDTPQKMGFKFMF